MPASAQNKRKQNQTAKKKRSIYSFVFEGKKILTHVPKSQAQTARSRFNKFRRIVRTSMKSKVRDVQEVLTENLRKAGFDRDNTDVFMSKWLRDTKELKAL